MKLPTLLLLLLFVAACDRPPKPVKWVNICDDTRSAGSDLALACRDGTMRSLAAMR